MQRSSSRDQVQPEHNTHVDGLRRKVENEMNARLKNLDEQLI